MAAYTDSVEKLIENLTKLPGIGRRSEIDCQGGEAGQGF